MNTGISRIWRVSAALFVMVLVLGSVYAAPTELNQSVTYSGQTITLHMHLETVRGSYFEVKVQNAAGGYDTYTPGEVRTYIGTVNEYPEAVVAGILQSDDQLRARVYFDRGKTWYTLGSSVYGTLGLGDPTWLWPTTANLAAGRAGTTMWGYDMAVDCDNRYYVVCGSGVATTVERVEFTLACTKAEYMKDALIRPGLGRVVIRAVLAKDPYAGTTGTALLDKLKAEWDANQTSANRDLAALATTAVGGGVAWLNSIGTTYAYCANDTDGDGNFDQVLRHESGHSWNVLDMQAGGPEGPTIDCGNAYGRFCGPELEPLLIDRNGHQGLLYNQGTYTANNLPPYPTLDLATPNVGFHTTLDVLANDHDANGHTLSLTGCQAISDKGGKVWISVGTGPGGRNQINYQPPGQLVFDTFKYTISDSSGQKQTGVAFANIQQGPTAPNQAPYFYYSPTTKSYALAGKAYSDTLATAATDPNLNDTLTFSKISGPTWLTVGTNGALSGTPGSGDVGTNFFTVQVMDSGGLTGQARLDINVYSQAPPYGDWKFDESSGTTAADSSGNNHPGEVSGAAWATGFKGNGLQFDGTDDFVTFGNGPSLSGTTDFTVSAWIKTSAATAGVIMQQRNGGFNGEYKFSTNADGTLQFMLYRDGYQFNFATAQTVNNGAWHHVVAIRNGLDGRVHIDGNPTPAGSQTGTTIGSLDSSISTAVGRDIRDSVQPFSGLIDEVRLYATALSGAEVQSLYNSYSGGANNPPTWNANPIVEPDATEHSAYSGTIANHASDPDSDPLTFWKVSGPGWLMVAANGALSGTPNQADVGLNSWTVKVDDGKGGAAFTTLQITVTNVIDPPVWDLNPLVELNATAGTAYSGTVKDHASDPDHPGTTLTFSKVSGPAWLTVAGSGALSGTPGTGDAGLNTWTIRVTDSSSLSADTALKILVESGPVAYYPSSYTVIQGSYVSGNVASLVSNDNNYLVIASQTSGTTRYATTDFTVTGITVSSPSKITVQVIAKSSRSSTTQRIKLWNYSTSVWDQKDSVTISTSEVTRSFDVTTGASSYISGGQLKVETNDSHGSKQSFNASHEVVSVTITP